MFEKHPEGIQSDPTDAAFVRNRERLVTDGGESTEHQRLNDRLTDFQQRILYILAEEARYGLAVKRALEAVYGKDVNHGRLYPNLDDLVDLGLIDKSSLDDRTNEYEITEDGLHWCREDAQWRLGKLDRTPAQAVTDGGEE